MGEYITHVNGLVRPTGFRERLQESLVPESSSCVLMTEKIAVYNQEYIICHCDEVTAKNSTLNKC